LTLPCAIACWTSLKTVIHIQPENRAVRPWRLFRGRRISLLALLFAASLPAASHAQALLVRAVDQVTGMGVSEAQLSLQTEGRREVSDAAGWIRVDFLQAGVHEGIVSASGYRSRAIRLEVEETSPPAPVEVILSPVVHDLTPFEVAAELTDEDRDLLAARQALAPSQQITGEALRDITDDGLGDTLEKVAGVTVSSEDGATSGINIRGAGARQTRVTLDGQSMAGGGGRGTTRGAGAMSQIPREFIQRIQVMKAPTPDMDADAIGGTVDFQTSRVAGSKSIRRSLALRSAYDDPGATWSHRINLTQAQPFRLGRKDRRAGLLIALNANTAARSNDSMRILNQWPLRTSPETGEAVRTLARLRAGRIENETQSYGLVLNADLQYDRNHQFFLKTLWSERDLDQSGSFHTTEFIRGRILSLLPQSGAFEGLRLEKQFLEKQQLSRTASVVLGAEHILGDWRVEESAGYSVATSKDKGTRNAIFHTGRDFDGGYDIAFSPSLPEIRIARDGLALSPAQLADPEPYSFTRYELIDNRSEDSELSLRLNLARGWESADARWTFKGGLKTRMREADQDQDKGKHFPASDPFSLAAVAAPGPETVYRGRYPIGPAWSDAAMEALFRGNPDDFMLDPMDRLLDDNASDFSVSESIHAAYAMTQWEAGKWIIVTGLRAERTESDTRGFETTSFRDENGQRVVEVRPVAISKQYDKVFPGLHILYRPTGSRVFRASLTRTLQRPDFRDLSPSMRVNLDARRIRSGNPELRPFDAKAFDLGADFMLSQWSAVSLGLFYKRIDDFIVDVEQETAYLDEPGFIQSMPVNGSPADLLGLEAAFNTSLGFLGQALEAADLSVNYTLADSSAVYPGYPDLRVMLPEQVRQTLSMSLRWRAGNWTINLRTRYRGLQLRELVRPGQDQFNAGVWNHSLSIGYKLNNSVQFSLGINGVNRPDNHSYLGDPQHAIMARAGSRSISMGLNVRFSGGRTARREQD
jgi:TonB-dependent receptor